MRKLTIKWLIKKGGCPEGINWFRENYPDEITLTKRDIKGQVERMSRENCTLPFSVGCNLHWLLKEMGKDTSHIYSLSWYEATQKKITDAFWKDYKEIK